MGNVPDTLTKLTPAIVSSFNNATEEEKQFGIEQYGIFKGGISSQTFEFMIFEMLICRVAEAFDYYLIQLISRIFRARPKTLTSSEKPLTVEEILACDSIDEIITRIVEKKVTGLSFSGLQDIIKELNKSPLSIGFDKHSQEFLHACEVFQTRNLIVHNSTLVNEVYFQRTSKLQYPTPENIKIRRCLPTK